jgi:metal-sulfur cluster biosynthetic enzyme
MAADEVECLSERGPEAIVRRVLDEANRIWEPCGLAQGLSVGMVDMGLIRDVEVKPCEGEQWNVHVRARVTSPDCLHFVYFERELRAAIANIADVAEVFVEWSDGSDWTPDCMSADLREQLKERRRRMMSALEKLTVGPGEVKR